MFNQNKNNSKNNIKYFNSNSKSSLLMGGQSQQFINNDQEGENDEEDIFRSSFYVEKKRMDNQTRQTFVSLQFIQKYFQQTSLSKIINKSIKNTLSGTHLPSNPFSMIHRFMMHESIYQNLKIFFASSKNSINDINSNFKKKQKHSEVISTAYIKENDNVNKEDQVLTKRIILNDFQLYAGSGIAQYINPDRTYILWKEMNSLPRMKVQKTLIQKYGFRQSFNSLGGTLLINLAGNSNYLQKNNQIKMPLSLNQNVHQLPLYSYTNDTMFETCCYVVSAQTQSSKSIVNFVSFVIDHSLEQMQNSQVYMFLIKLSIFDYEENSITEWSLDQLINQRNKITKEMIKLLSAQKRQVKCRYSMKVNKEMAQILGQNYLTMQRRYVLIEENASGSNVMIKTKRNKESGNYNIHCLTPISLIFQHIFEIPDYYEITDNAFRLSELQNDQIQQIYCKEASKKFNYYLKSQQVSSLCWQLFFISMKDSKCNIGSLRAMNYIINSPLSYLHQQLHYFKMCRSILNPSYTSSGNPQTQLYQLIEKAQTILLSYQRKGQYLYPQVKSMQDILRKLISVILLKQKLKVNVANLIIDNIILILKCLIGSFHVISYVLQGHLAQYVNSLNQRFGSSYGKKCQQMNVNYDNFIKNNKNIPSKTLSLYDQSKRVRKELTLSQNQAKDSIMAKYVAKFQLYQIIYNFYWQLICGKKIKYPLSEFIIIMKSKSLIQDYREIKENEFLIKSKNKKLQKTDVVSNKVDGINIFEMSMDSKLDYVFYSLKKESLYMGSLLQYQKIYQVFAEFFQTQNQYIKGKKVKYILSVKALPSVFHSLQEITGMNTIKLFVDVIIQSSIRRSDLYSIIYEQLTNFMFRADKKQIGVLGIFASWGHISNTDLGSQGADEDQVFSWTTKQNINILKFDYKNKIPIQKMFKFLDYCNNYKKQIQVRLIYTTKNIIKSCILAFNFYYIDIGQASIGSNYNVRPRSTDGQLLVPFISINNHYQRVFYKKSQILQWSNFNKVKSLNYTKEKQMQQPIISTTSISINANSQENINSPLKANTRNSQALIGSLKKIYNEEQVELAQLIVQDEDQIKMKSNNLITMDTIRQFSPFYSKLQQSYSQCMNVIYLIEYLKLDRRGRFQLQKFYQTIQLIQYYLLDKCMKQDNYIFAQGNSVMVLNLINQINEYFQNHKDNEGQEKELIYLQRLVYKLISIIKFSMIEVSVSIAFAIRNS